MENIKCNLCNGLPKRAVATPCCNQLACQSCSKRRLKAEDNRCWVPSCKKQIFLTALIPNKKIRKKVKRLTSNKNVTSGPSKCVDAERLSKVSDAISRDLKRIDKAMEDVKKVLDYTYRIKKMKKANVPLNAPKPTSSKSAKDISGAKTEENNTENTELQASTHVAQFGDSKSPVAAAVSTATSSAPITTSKTSEDKDTDTSCSSITGMPTRTTVAAESMVAAAKKSDDYRNDVVLIDLTEKDDLNEVEIINNKEKIQHEVNVEKITFAFSDPTPIHSVRRADIPPHPHNSASEQNRHYQPYRELHERQDMRYQHWLPPRQLPQRRRFQHRSHLNQYFQQQQNWEMPLRQSQHKNRKEPIRRRREAQRQKRWPNYQEFNRYTFTFAKPTELPISSHHLEQIKIYLLNRIFCFPHLYELSVPTPLFEGGMWGKTQPKLFDRLTPLKVQEYFQLKRQESILLCDNQKCQQIQRQIPAIRGTEALLSTEVSSSDNVEYPASRKVANNSNSSANSNNHYQNNHDDADTKQSEGFHIAKEILADLISKISLPPGSTSAATKSQCDSYWCGGIPRSLGNMERPDSQGNLFFLQKCERCPTLDLKCVNDINIHRHPLEKKHYELSLHVAGVEPGAYIKIWTVPPRVERVGDGGMIRMIAPGVGTCWVKEGTKIFDCQKVRIGTGEKVVVSGNTPFWLSPGKAFSYTFNLVGDARNAWHRELVYLVLDDRYSHLLVKEGAVGVIRRSKCCWAVTVTLVNPANLKEPFYFPGGRIGVLEMIKPEQQ